MNHQLNFQEERPDFLSYALDVLENRHPISLALDGVEDERNFGSIFRLADATRLKHVYTFAHINQNEKNLLKKVARAADKYVPHTQLRQWEALRELHPQAQIVALEVTTQSIPIWDFILQGEVILVVGNEKNGINPDHLQSADCCIHIPMYGINTSMNVAMATGIAVYELLRQLERPKL